MAKHNAANTRIKRVYFDYLEHAQRRHEASIDQVAKAISRFEEGTGFKDFKKFHREQAKAFKLKLSTTMNARTGKLLSRATVHSTLSALRAFFIWLAGQPGYKSKISYSDADYFNLSEKEVRIAKATREKPVPTLEQVHHVLTTMPAESDIERRDRALIALALLTGARAAALASFKLKHIDLKGGCINQDAREVKTKNSKTFTTWFCPVGGDALQIVTDWCDYLRKDLLWSEDDPLFPKTQIGIGEQGAFAAMGLAREPWSGTGAIRTIYKQAFKAAGLSYFNPHCFRNVLTTLGERICTTVEEMKAWSQNVGHNNVMTTLMNYGAVPATKQAELIRGMADRQSSTDEEAKLAAEIASLMRKHRNVA
ncbi:tyrosine-type recombinase/integrase [Altericroceibacterium endophyticum]|uniref:Tyrosine-type recombinase/integrase n=1 Tax=Altericroceibacterium endophyticum TaxID=1808508 RepID=A0A6I4T5V5_9SPHN|nr:tyrosine-type recombinase/integrase [Altericroceibacterium endophyticum]MXO66584.1 tyrosine-type recombinase/integrase [Altericroceibacterium endophyticum]